MKNKAAAGTAIVIAAVLVGGGITVALASAGRPEPAGSVLPQVSITTTVPSPSSATTNIVPPVDVSSLVQPVPAQPLVPVNNGGMNAPQEPEELPVPIDDNGDVIPTPVHDDPPPPPEVPDYLDPASKSPAPPTP